MERKFLLILLTALFTKIAAAQPSQVKALKKQADSLYKMEDYRHSAQLFSSILEIPDYKPTVEDRWNAACAWALSNDADKAFLQLESIANSGQTSFEKAAELIKDQDLLSLHSDKRWNKFKENLFTHILSNTNSNAREAYKNLITAKGFRKKAKNELVSIDEAHFNLHTKDGLFAAFAELLRMEGYTVNANKTQFTKASLQPNTVLIISNPFPDLRDSLVARAARAKEPFRWSAAACNSAFTDEEILAVNQWVKSGGSLLLILDHAPHGITGGKLAASFGVECRNVATDDTLHRDKTIKTPTIMFTRKNGLLGDDKILDGIDSVVTYLGQSLKGPSNARTLLKLPETAIDMDWDPITRKNRAQSAAGRVQGLAMEYGKGRIIVMGEAAGFAYRGTDDEEGILRQNRGNLEMSLNIMRWLASAGD